MVLRGNGNAGRAVGRGRAVYQPCSARDAQPGKVQHWISGQVSLIRGEEIALFPDPILPIGGLRVSIDAGTAAYFLKIARLALNIPLQQGSCPLAADIL